MAVTSDIDLYDSDILNIEKVLLKLNDKVGQSHDYEAFTREVRERFAEIGLNTSVAWYEYAVDGKKVEGSAMPEISIIGRTEELGEFDHERLAHEVQSNLLELPGQEAGLIKVDNETVRRFMEQHGKHD